MNVVVRAICQIWDHLHCGVISRIINFNGWMKVLVYSFATHSPLVFTQMIWLRCNAMFMVFVFPRKVLFSMFLIDIVKCLCFTLRATCSRLVQFFQHKQFYHVKTGNSIAVITIWIIKVILISHMADYSRSR